MESEVIMSEAPPFFTRYGFSRPDDSATALVVRPYPEICRASALRATIIASAIDVIGGLITREIAGVDAIFTRDLSLRIPRPGTPALLRAEGTLLRTGRRLVTTEVTIKANESVYAYGETTFWRIAREASEAPDVAVLSTPRTIPNHPLEHALDREVGIRVIDASLGRVSLDLRPALLNPEGVMQGALVALAVESAALAMAESAHREPQAVTELDLRYLASAGTGPIISEASWIGTPKERMLRVALRDAGKGDRQTATALIRVGDV